MKELLHGGQEAALRLAQHAHADAKILLLLFAWGCAPSKRERLPAGSIGLDGSVVRRRTYGSGARRA